MTIKKPKKRNKKSVKAKMMSKKKTVNKKKLLVKKKKIIPCKKNNIPKEIAGMRTASFGYLITAIFELVMAIPIIGWLIGFSSFGMMWIIGIILNIVVIVVLINRKKPIYANIVGVGANVFGVVPIVGWFLHLIAMTLLFILFFKEENKNC